MGANARWQAGLLPLLLLAAWLVSDHYPPWLAFHSEVPALLAAAVVVVGALGWRGEGRASVLAVLLLGLAGLPWLQWLAGQLAFSGDALLASLYLAGAGLCVWAGGAAPPAVRERLMLALAGAVLAAAILCAGIAAYQWLDLSGLGMWVALNANRRMGANFGQSNHLATLLCLGLAAAALFRTRGHIGVATALAAAGFIVIGLALTQSRVPWLIVLLLVLWRGVRHKRFARPDLAQAAVVVGLLVWYLLAFWAVAQGSQVTRDGALVADTRLATGTRPALWMQTIHALLQSPWLGYGWLQGDAAQAMGAVVVAGHEYTGGFGHNFALDLMVWNGVPLGALLCVAFVVWYVRLGLRAEGSAQWFRFAVISCFAAHAMVEYPYAYAYFLVPLAILAGQFEADAGGARLRVPRALLAVVAAAGIAASVAIVHDYFKVEADLRDLRAQLLRIGGARQSEPPGDVWVLDQMLAAARAGRIEPAKGMPAEQLRELVVVSRRFSTRFFLQQAAIALALNGRGADAELGMRQLRGIYGEDRYRQSLAQMERLASEQQPELLPFVAAWRALAATPQR